MPNPQSPFSSDYDRGSQSTTDPGQGHIEGPPLIPEEPVVNLQLYGTGKPRRVVIRGKISRE